MSDSNANAPYDAAAEPGPAWRERKNLLVAGGAGAAVVIGLLGYFLVFAGGSSDDTGGGLVAGAHTNSVASASPSANAATLPAVYKADPVGNPFAPLYPAAPTASPSAAADTAVAADANASAVPTQASAATPAPVSTPAPATSKTVTVKLVSIVDDDTVTIRLNNGAPFAVNVDQSFGGVFSLASTWPDEHEATFNYGDGPPYTLAVNETKKFVVTS